MIIEISAVWRHKKDEWAKENRVKTNVAIEI